MLVKIEGEKKCCCPTPARRELLFCAIEMSTFKGVCGNVESLQEKRETEGKFRICSQVCGWSA